MLTEVNVKNLALIREASVSFKNGLNILTGETGAGKSIIIDSIALTLGAIGSIVPGIGNAIGLALGGLIGYGIYRADKHRLNKVLKKKEEN